jgi:hypothetical protein
VKEEGQVESQESCRNRHFPLGPLPTGWTSGTSLSSECNLEMRVSVLDTSGIAVGDLRSRITVLCLCGLCADRHGRGRGERGSGGLGHWR